MRIPALILTLGLASCGVFRPTRVPPPPRPAPVRLPLHPSHPAPAPPPLLPAPPPLPVAGNAPRPPALVLPAPVYPSAPRRRPVKVRRSAPTPPPEPAEPEPPPAPEPAPLPQLGPVLSPALRTELLRQTDALLVLCDRAVADASLRRLTPAQANLLDHLRTLAQLAREARDRSPAEAHNLAQRARLFADRLHNHLP
jgi:hypothetical protein